MLWNSTVALVVAQMVVIVLHESADAYSVGAAFGEGAQIAVAGTAALKAKLLGLGGE